MANENIEAKRRLLKEWNQICTDLKNSGRDLASIKIVCPCRSAITREEYLRKHSNRVTIDDETYTIKELAEKTGIPYGTLLGRYNRGDRGKRLIRSVKNEE